MINELRQKTKAGMLYARRPKVTEILGELDGLARTELVRRCKIEGRSDPEYVPSECLLYLVRSYRGRQPDEVLECLFTALMARVLRALPADSSISRGESFSKGELRERVAARFQDMLLGDRNGYVERLDFFEVSFDRGIATLKVTAQRELFRQRERLLPLSDESGTHSLADEKSESLYRSSELEPNLNNPHYRIPLQSAIEKLSVTQKRIIQMYFMGFAIHSDDPTELTISKALGKSERTIRSQRDRALASIRAELSGGEEK